MGYAGAGGTAQCHVATLRFRRSSLPWADGVSQQLCFSGPKNSRSAFAQLIVRGTVCSRQAEAESPAILWLYEGTLMPKVFLGVVAECQRPIWSALSRRRISVDVVVTPTMAKQSGDFEDYVAVLWGGALCETGSICSYQWLIFAVPSTSSTCSVQWERGTCEHCYRLICFVGGLGATCCGASCHSIAQY